MRSNTQSIMEREAAREREAVHARAAIVAIPAQMREDLIATTWCGMPDDALPAWTFPMTVRAMGADGIEENRDTFVDRRAVLYVFRGNQAYNGNIEAPYVRRVHLRQEGIYFRTVEGLYRKRGFRAALGEILRKLPPGFVPAIAGSILINLAAGTKEWDGSPDSNVRRIGYRFRPARAGGAGHVEWITVSNRCYGPILDRTV